jgi:hypothetical protein
VNTHEMSAMVRDQRDAAARGQGATYVRRGRFVDCYFRDSKQRPGEWSAIMAWPHKDPTPGNWIVSYAPLAPVVPEIEALS